MNNLFSKFAFGFVMAQLFPGAILLVTLSIALWPIHYWPLSLIEALNETIGYWTSSSTNLVIATVLSVGFGMGIHGINWSVIGYLENRNSIPGKKPTPIYKTFWHDKRVIYQILLGPIKIGIEILDFLINGKKLSEIFVAENVADIPEAKWDAFIFVENYYLNFAQFYAHTSYALIMSILVVIEYIIMSICNIKVVLLYIAIFITMWVISGTSFVISRIQFASLFTAEEEISRK